MATTKSQVSKARSVNSIHRFDGSARGPRYICKKFAHSISPEGSFVGLPLIHVEDHIDLDEESLAKVSMQTLYSIQLSREAITFDSIVHRSMSFIHVMHLFVQGSIVSVYLYNLASNLLPYALALIFALAERRIDNLKKGISDGLFYDIGAGDALKARLDAYRPGV